MPITLDDIKTAVAIIENSEGAEITLRSGDVTLIVRRGEPGLDPVGSAGSSSGRSASASVPPAQASTPPQGLQAAPAPLPSVVAPSASAIPLLAPLTGVVYRAPAPEEPPFVEDGASVGPDDTVCIIDVMKVMNLIKAPAAGRIARIAAQDGQQVTRGDVILWVDPA